MPNVSDYIVKFEPEFTAIFGVKFRRLVRAATGFDIVAFDDQVVKSGNESMRDALSAKFGDRSVELIAEIMQYEIDAIAAAS